MLTRIRTIIDDRHSIRNPFGNNPNDMEIWANTLVKTRIPDLFRNNEGVRGHAEQLQNELNRLAKIEGCSGDVVDKALNIERFIRHSLNESKKNAMSNPNYHCHWHFY